LFRTLLLCGLIAAVSGPLLRQAEGADDLARSLAELGDPPLVEGVDGGVGDDSGAAVVRIASNPNFDLQICSPLDTSLTGSGAFSLCSWPLSDPQRLGVTAIWVADRGGTLLHLAWLQRLLN
jgi:hypothetical protein